MMKPILAVTGLWLATFGTANAQQQPTSQQIIDQREALQIGALLKNNISLSVQLEAANDALAKAQARIKELEAKVPK
jgi:uncharacterized membrane protein